MWLIVGLGNPGAEYAATRHNIGFLLVDELAANANARFTSVKKFHSEAVEITIDGEKALLLKPQTYMNNSGRAVQAAMSFYKIALDKIIVVHDELDLPLGKLRIKKGGGNNGHNGLKDIDACIGPEYWRMRLGIAHPGDKSRVHDHVLGRFWSEEAPIVADFIVNLAKNFALFWQHSPAGLMSKMTLEKEKPDGI